MNVRIFKTGLASLVAASTLFAASSQANAAYTLTILDSLGGSITSVYGINASGQIVGSSHLPGDTAYHAALWSGSAITDLGTIRGGSSIANAVNISGKIVGRSGESSSGTSTPYHAVFWNGTNTTDLGTLGGTFSEAKAINSSGQIVGWSDTITNRHATLWNGNTASDLGSLGAGFSYANAINAWGQIVGSSDLGSTTHATLWDHSTSTDLGTLPGSDNSEAYAINDTGQIVGKSSARSDGISHATFWNGATASSFYNLGGMGSEAKGINSSGQIVGWGETPDLARHATLWLWSGDKATDLNSFLDASAVNAGWVLNEALGINDSGIIVGLASDSLLGIQYQAFSISPIPEPETYAMMLSGLGLLAYMKRRRKSFVRESPTN